MIKKSVLFLFFSFQLLLGFTQTALDLKELIQLVLNNNYDIKLSDFDKQIAGEENTNANAGASPRVRLLSDLRYSAQFIGDPTTLAKGFLHTFGVNPKVQTDWVLFGGKRVRNAKSGLENKEKGASLKSQLTIEAKLVTAIALYYKGIILLQNEKLIQDLLNQSKKNWNASEHKFRNGLINGYDFNQNKVSFLDDSIKLFNIKTEIEDLNKQLKQVCALGDDANFVLEGVLPNEFPDYDYKVLKEKVLKNNYRLRIESSITELKRLEFEVEKANKKPLILGFNQVYLDANYLESQFTDINFAGNARFLIGLTLNWTLWDGGKMNTQINVAKLNYEKEQLNNQKLINSIENDLYANYKKYYNNRQLLALYDEKVKSIQYTFQMAEKQYAKGLMKSFEYFQAKQLYEKSLSDLAKAQYKTMMQELELIRLSGGILNYYVGE